MSDGVAQAGEWVLLAPISDRAVRVYALLQAHVRHHGLDAGWPSHAELAAKIHVVKPEAVGLAIRELVRIGALDVQIMNTDDGRRSFYRFLPEPDGVTAPTVENPTYLDERWAGGRGNVWDVPRGPVVYWLYDKSDVLAYVGSTGYFVGRMHGHDAKPWTRFEARLCISRRAAYTLEYVEIDSKLPYLNRKRLEVSA